MAYTELVTKHADKAMASLWRRVQRGVTDDLHYAFEASPLQRARMRREQPRRYSIVPSWSGFALWSRRYERRG